MYNSKNDKLVIKVFKTNSEKATVGMRTTAGAKALIDEASRKTGLPQIKISELFIKFAAERLEIKEK